MTQTKKTEVELSVSPQIFKSAIARGRDRHVEGNTPHGLYAVLINPRQFQRRNTEELFMLSAIISEQSFADLKLPM